MHTTTQLNDYRYRGARAAILLHEQTLREFIQTWEEAKAAGIALPETKDPTYDSYDSMLHHVFKWAREYMVWICEQLKLPDPQIDPPPPVERIAKETAPYLEHLLQQWRKPLVEVRRLDFYRPSYNSPWDIQYCIDAMMEHAVMHPVRHRFQLLELIGKR